MHLNCVLTIVLSLAIHGTYSSLADKGKFESLKPSLTPSLPDVTRAINFKESSEDAPKTRQRTDDETAKIQDSSREKEVREFDESRTSDSADDHQCCGSSYDVGSQSRPETRHRVSNGGSPKDLSDNGRYTSRYGSHPEDRFVWHSYNPAAAGRRGAATSSATSSSGSGTSGSEGLYGSHSGGDRYGGSRPSYSGGDYEYERPGNSGNRPLRPNYGHGGGGHVDNGAYGSHGYEVNRPGGYGGNRPPGGLHFGGGRPGGGSYGGGGYGGGGHGVYGTIGEEEEFPGQTDGADAGPQHPSNHNLQTQKAVALKALAGVALIGAAAALATNPVLLPIGVLAGRRKRSVHSNFQDGDIDTERLIELLEKNVPKFYRGKINKEVLASPTCIARLACEIQRKYVDDWKKMNVGDGDGTDLYDGLRNQLVNLFKSKVQRSDVHYKNMRKLLKSAEAFDGHCNVFVCDSIKN